ncbi:uncharacterized protein PV06_03588 [Exophiala oligosperma]|uniref:CID domain-containing protein n=2 Tax=Chaetothyriales TaxID=34395 RepID=A0A0D2DRX9_9EURO|nr:uncharacterized protein PV06_03588 [Exophiala oligosperma]KAJ9642746.1 hypothetical protein H2204_002394 [Knufia peltigerae]KIW45185.1 hypothetical protein PV06_03588 [Exophiala oligosperma]
MADPFEVRMRFTNLLTHLSASATASIKTAHYALKHRDMDEDLHSCIIENLERGNNMNNRANIMYFLEHHADINSKEGGHEAYVDMIRRDIQRIVDAVAQSGANVKVVRRVVMGLGDKGVLSAQVTAGIETGLKEKEDKMGKLLGDDDKPEDGDTPVQVDDTRKPTPRTAKGSVSKMDKRAIEQRIEEDRERNKRLRESVWAVSGDDQEEFDRMWEEETNLSEDERVIADEEAEERLQFVRYYKSTTLGR